VKGGVVIAASAITRAGLFVRSRTVKKDQEEEVSPAEDLMREHGILKRVLGIYDLGQFTSKV